jgi:hypothetical protein
MATQQVEKLALGASKYIKPIPRPFTRKTEEQMNEYYGLGHFHTKSHEDLSKSQQAINTSFKSCKIPERIALANQEVTIWRQYIEQRKSELPEFLTISKGTQNKLHRMWALQLHRNTDSIEGSRMLEFHSEFLKNFAFEVPLDKRSVFEMLHPHAGYMVTLPYRFTFNKLIDFYHVQLVATYERTLGEELLSRQISCFNYFDCVADGGHALMELAKVNQLMETFKFPKFASMKEFVKYFEKTLQEFDGEFSGVKENDPFLRFALMRKIFLDYNL